MEYQNFAESEKVDDFYNSKAAEQMAKEYTRASADSKKHITDALETADALERQIKSMRSLLLYRRRLRLEIRLQRVLLNILISLSPDDKQLGTQVYNRLLDCVARLEKMC